MSQLNRRNALAVIGAGLPVLAAPPSIAVAEDDPIFAAIERCRLASAAHAASCKDEPDDLDDIYDGWYEKQTRACLAESEACTALATLEPTTLAGIIAAITYVDEQTAAGNYAFDGDRLGLMLTSTRNALVKIAAVQS